VARAHALALPLLASLACGRVDFVPLSGSRDGSALDASADSDVSTAIDGAVEPERDADTADSPLGVPIDSAAVLDSGSGPDGGGIPDGAADGPMASSECMDDPLASIEHGLRCGGQACPTCACGMCSVDSDCASGSCGTSERCALVTQVYIDWRLDCSELDESLVVVPSLPSGRYRFEALPSAGRYGGAPQFPWNYFVFCDDVDFAIVGDGNTPEAAFADIGSPVREVDWPGGDLRCGMFDSACSDNEGGVAFRLELLCPGFGG
jgi:hypothetical protein